MNENEVIQEVNNRDKTTDEISLSHEDLKEIGKQYLKEQGYEEDEIKKEYTINFHDREYRIDVVGLKNDRIMVAIECGSVSYEKMTVLTNTIRKVVHIPFHNQVVDLRIVSLNKEKKRLENEIEKTKNKLNILSKEIENLIPIVSGSCKQLSNNEFNVLLLNSLLKKIEGHPCIRQVITGEVRNIGFGGFYEAAILFASDIVNDYIKQSFSQDENDSESNIMREKFFNYAAKELLPHNVSLDMNLWSARLWGNERSYGVIDGIILLSLIVTNDSKEYVRDYLGDIILKERGLK